MTIKRYPAKVKVLKPCKVIKTDENGWKVESDSGNTYTVWDAGVEDAEYGGGMHCSCIAGQFGRSCKHLAAVFQFIKETNDEEKLQ